jgi:hypothetical protein
MTATFSLTRMGNPIALVVLTETEATGDEANAQVVNELQPCGFQVDDREPESPVDRRPRSDGDGRGAGTSAGIAAR